MVIKMIKFNRQKRHNTKLIRCKIFPKKCIISTFRHVLSSGPLVLNLMVPSLRPREMHPSLVGLGNGREKHSPSSSYNPVVQGNHIGFKSTKHKV